MISSTASKVLSHPHCSANEAATTLGVTKSKVAAWISHRATQNPKYAQGLPSTYGSIVLDWGEFVQLALLREYWCQNVPVYDLAALVEELSKRHDTLYPLATRSTFVDRSLLGMLQETFDLPYNLRLVNDVSFALTEEVERFIAKAEFADTPIGPVERIFPLGKSSPITIDPMIRFGRPNVDGVAVERLFELHNAGETVQQIAKSYDMSVSAVNSAIAYKIGSWSAPPLVR